MKVIITGGKGFIGSHLTDRLINNGFDVTVLDDDSGGDNINPKARYLRLDCRNERAVDSAFNMVKPDIVYHLAANAAENKAQFSPIDVTSRNYDAFIKVLTPFIKYGGKRFIFTSSIAVYGRIPIPFNEADTLKPKDLYGITKLAAEKTLEIMSLVHKFEFVTLRFHNVYGPRQNMTDPYRNVVTIFMNAIMNKKPIYIYGDGEQKRGFTYIDDIVDALDKSIFCNVKNRAFNIGTDTITTLNQLAIEIGYKGKPIYLPERPQEVKVAIADHMKAKLYLGYRDKTSLKIGLEKTWEWAKAMGPQKPIYTPLEINSDIAPANWKEI